MDNKAKMSYDVFSKKHRLNFMKKIFVYSGPGALNTCLKHTLFTLKSTLGSDYQISTLSAHQLLHTSWYEQAALFVMPGGADLPYVNKLNGLGNVILRSYVENGGKYLGICAGSYYAGNYVDFAKGTDIEVQGKRELAFFKGRVSGPILAPYDYESNSGARAAQIYWNGLKPPFKKNPLTVFYAGGGYFVDAHKTPHTHVLAHYSLGAQFPCLVECQIKSGIALLSNVHFEYDPSLLNLKDPFLKYIIPELEKAQLDRMSLISHLWKRLGLY